MNSIEATKAIRNELKKCGYSNRKVSVKHEYCGYSSSIRVVVKDLSINLAWIRKIAYRYKDIDYDEVTQEILEGGNTYVFVDYDYTILEEATTEKEAEAKKILDSIKDVRSGSFCQVLAENDLYTTNLYKGDNVGYKETLAVIRFTPKTENSQPQPSIFIYYPRDLASYLALNDCQTVIQEESA